MKAKSCLRSAGERAAATMVVVIVGRDQQHHHRSIDGQIGRRVLPVRIHILMKADNESARTRRATSAASGNPPGDTDEGRPAGWLAK
jgi:hypothetical protein